MDGRQAPTFLIPPQRRQRALGTLIDVYPPNFGLLNSDASWRTTWATIVSGRFMDSPFSSLLFVEDSTAYAELYDTDGQGALRTPLRGQFNPLGGRTTWTHIVPGYFGPSGYTGLLLYDQAAGFGQFYDSDGKGGFVFQSEYSGWRTTWSQIVSGRFVLRSPYSAVFFYSASENYGEVWATDGKGLTEQSPHQTFPNFWKSTFTHVLAGEFHWTPGYIDQVPTLTDLFFYDAVTGRGEMYRSDFSSRDRGPQIGSIVPRACATSESLPRGIASVAAGSFGGTGYTDLAFYDGDAGAVIFYSFIDVDGSDTSANLVLRETCSGLPRAPAGMIVSGTFVRSNPEDHWFDDGPSVNSVPPYDPDWRFGPGGFSDLLLYDRAAGQGSFYFHEPLPPPLVPLEGYITSQSSHGGAPPVSTGSVLPGESIVLHVSSQQGPYTITIYRQGVFASGATELLMATVTGLPSNPAPLPIARNAWRDGAQWPAVATLVIPDWPTGLYATRVQTTGASPQTIDLHFVVRARMATPSAILLVLADTTVQAYNQWGGRNAYGHLTAGDFAGAYPSTSSLRVPFGFQLAFDRPQYEGWGNVVETWEIPFMEWLAQGDWG